jgi:hypothetical protein
MDPVLVLPGMGYAIRQGLLGMAVEAEPPELGVRLGDGTGGKGVLVDLV